MNDIIQACQDGNEEVFMEWLTQLPDPQQALNQRDIQGLTLLHHAIRGGNKKIILAIVQKGGDVMAEVPRERNIPLNMAILMPDKVTSKEVADVLLGIMQELETYPSKNKEGNYPIHLACKVGDTDLVKTLMRVYPNTVYETNKRRKSPLGVAISESQTDVVRLLVDGTMGRPTKFKDFNTSALFPTFNSKYSLDLPVNVFVVGDNSSGKSTLIRSIESDSFYDRFWGIAYSTQNVPENTAGLVPTVYIPSKHKRVIFYDLASGSKCTHQNLIESADGLKRSLFIIVIDSRPDKKDMERRLEFWMTFIHAQCSHVTEDATHAPIRPNVIVVGSYRDILKPFRLDQPDRLKAVYKSVKRSNRQLASCLNLIDYHSLDCRKAESPGMKNLRGDLQRLWAQLSQSKDQVDQLHSHCYILSNVFLEMEEENEEDTIPAIKLRDLAKRITENASKEEIGLYHLLPQDTTTLFKLCKDLEERERVLLMKNYRNASEEDTWIIYGKHKLATMIDNAFNQFLLNAGGPLPRQNPIVALMRKDTLEECLAPVMSLGMDILEQLLEYFKFHDSSIRDLVGLPADHDDTPLYFFPTLLPKKDHGIDTPWDMEKSRGFGWSFLPANDQEFRCFLPRFLMSLLFLIFQSNHEGIVFTSRYLWTEGVYLKAEEIEVCVTTNSKAITLNMKYKSDNEISALIIRNLILNNIRELKQSLQPKTKTEEYVIPKDGAKFPVSSPSTPIKWFNFKDIKETINITASNLSLSSAGISTSEAPDSTTSETLPFFEPCLSLVMLNTVSRQFLIEPDYCDEGFTGLFLREFERCMGSTYFRNLAKHFEIQIPQHPLHRTSMSSVTSDGGSDDVSIVQGNEILSSPVFDSEEMPDQANCSTYGKLVECLDKISIFNTSQFLKEMEGQHIRSGYSKMGSSLTVPDSDTVTSSSGSPSSVRLHAHTTKETSATFSQSDLSGVHFVDKSIKVFLCHSSGGKVVSASDDITLTIPEGAVPVSSSPISIEFGVALQGPFELPGDMVPVSPFIWFCVQGENFKFERAIEIVLPHFMNCQKEADSVSLVFLKASHRQGQKKFIFKESKDKAIFHSNNGKLSTNHSCFICIGCNTPESIITNANYCLLKVVPRTLSDHKGQLHFYLTFFLKTCFEIIYRQFGEDYEIDKKMVRLAAPQSGAATDVKVNLENTFKRERNDGWVIGNSGGNWEITASEIMFWNQGFHQLREGMYPPRFTVEVDGSDGTKGTVRIDINFLGLDKKLQYQIPIRGPIRQGSFRSLDSSASERSYRTTRRKNSDVRALYNRHIQELTQYLDVDEVRIVLMAQGTLSDAELDMLVSMSSEANPRRKLMVEKLVGMLKPKGEEGLMRFKQALEETEANVLGHSTILETLHADEEFQAIKDRLS